METPRPVSDLLRGRRFWLVAFALATAFGLLLFGYRYSDVLVRGGSEPAHIKFIEEMTGAYGALVLFPVIIWTARRIRTLRLPLAIPTYLASATGLSLVHTTWNWASRVAAFAAIGHGAYDYGIMRLRYLMELPNDVIWYTVFGSLVLFVDHYATARDREVRVAQLEGELSRARLQSLEAQLQPHFLFNALNTVSAVMYEDVAAADTVIARLGDLLRRTLQRHGVAEVSLAEEIETLELYCDIVRARFADRLDIVIDVDDDAKRGAVPQLVLQPLVENAIKHGDPGPGRRARVAVRGRRENGSLVVEVEDNGPGLTDAAPFAGEPGGIGLTNTRRRLEQLYGERQRLDLTPCAGGGLRVAIEIPWRPAAPPAGVA